MKRLIFCYIFCALTVLETCADLDICLTDGSCLRGTLMPGYQKGEFEAFMGIPYAQPPIGDLRFRNPVPATAWKQTLDASSPKDPCIQKNFFLKDWPVYGSEDCLYLNVYRPLRRSAEPLPVMVYFHAGGFFCGSASIGYAGPEYLMDTEQVIMVSMSYRLGPFGFLSTGNEHMPGNFGLKDQRLALQWVQKHIGSFGGDPQLVTIFGHSAGGASTHFHMLSEGSKGLFQRAMTLSGALAPWAKFEENPLAQVQKLAVEVGIKDAMALDCKTLTEALRKVDAKDITEGSTLFKQWNMLPLVNFLPTVEDPSTPDGFFYEDPWQIQLSGRAHQVPWVLGADSRAGEGLIMLLPILNDPVVLAEFNENFLERFPLAMPLPAGTSAQEIKDLLHLYGISEYKLNNETLPTLLEIVGDFDFQYPVYVSAKASKLDKHSVSIYSFEYRGQRTMASLFVPNGIDFGLGSSHLDDAMFTLRLSALMSDFPKDSEEAMVIKRFTSILVDFAKTGVFYNQSSLPACSAQEFTDEEICSFLKIEKRDGAYNEAIERRVDMRALPIWKKMYLE
ncbi:cholinesterase 1 [Scaptodrosophila lebanonensis]|uniref:Carboxylic ester hydrolase n=1 Tax=Drosophila lebanonensis TaxID=7225 RepID=A0A6J2TZA2_DROLE|nr:cholinesterase 1 [Scaptodrosophila lebanonensis]